jgi:hypothetical protein
MSDAVYRVQSACECEALLEAELDERRHVLHGWTRRGGEVEPAPANSVHPERERFDIVWQCPVCGRNTLRLIHAGALERVKPAAEPTT